MYFCPICKSQLQNTADKIVKTCSNSDHKYIIHLSFDKIKRIYLKYVFENKEYFIYSGTFASTINKITISIKDFYNDIYFSAPEFLVFTSKNEVEKFIIRSNKLKIFQ